LSPAETISGLKKWSWSSIPLDQRRTNSQLSMIGSTTSPSSGVSPATAKISIGEITFESFLKLYSIRLLTVSVMLVGKLILFVNLNFKTPAPLKLSKRTSGDLAFPAYVALIAFLSSAALCISNN